MGQRVTQVDAFTVTPFTGNPAAVCVLSQPGDAVWMQQVACEMNLAETTFLYRQGDGFSLRRLTPAVEVDLCGHATLASAHTLWEEGYLSADEPARFYTRNGLLTATRDGAWINLEFPATPAAPAEAPADLIEALDRRRVVFTGYLRGEALAQAYASADVFAFPSLTETFGQAVMEVMASGVPVVGYDAERVRDSVRHAETGLLAPARETAQFTAHLRSLLTSPSGGYTLACALTPSVIVGTWSWPNS